MAFEKTTWKRLDASLRAELEAVLQTKTPAFQSDYQDLLGWWLLVLIAAVGGLGAAAWDLSSDSLSLSEQLSLYLELPHLFFRNPRNLGVVAALVAGPWALSQIIRCRGRCGFAALSDALVVMRGPKLKVLRYADIASASRHIVRAKNHRFTVLTLKLKDGTTKSLDVHGTWAEQVLTSLAPPRAG